MSKIEEAAKNLSSRSLRSTPLQEAKIIQIKDITSGKVKDHEVKKQEKAGNLTVTLYKDYGNNYGVAVTTSSYNPEGSLDDRKKNIGMTPTTGVRKAGKMLTAMVAAAKDGEKDLVAIVKAGKAAIGA